MAFDLTAFLEQAVDPLPTNYENVPVGEHEFFIDADPAQLTPQEVSGENDKGPYKFFVMELNCILQDDAIRAKLNREKVTVRLRINLDFTPDGRLDNGVNKNVMLGKLREALGQNNPGWTPRQLLGAGPFLGKVTHQSSKKQPDVKFAEITQVAPPKRK